MLKQIVRVSPTRVGLRRYASSSTLPSHVVQYNEALKYLSEGNSEKASVSLQSVIDTLKPRVTVGEKKDEGEIQILSSAYYNMANVQLQSGDMTKARELWLKSNDIDGQLACEKRNADAYINLANLEVLESSRSPFPQFGLQKAIEHYRKALEIAPEDAELHFNIGVVSDRLGDLDTALQYYESASEMLITQATDDEGKRKVEYVQMIRRNAIMKKFGLDPNQKSEQSESETAKSASSETKE